MTDRIVALRVEECPNPVVESVKQPCVDCGQDCWVSRGTRAGAPEGAQVTCTICLMTALKEGRPT